MRHTTSPFFISSNQPERNGGARTKGGDFQGFVVVGFRQHVCQIADFRRLGRVHRFRRAFHDVICICTMREEKHHSARAAVSSLTVLWNKKIHFVRIHAFLKILHNPANETSAKFRGRYRE